MLRDVLRDVLRQLCGPAASRRDHLGPTPRVTCMLCEAHGEAACEAGPVKAGKIKVFGATVCGP